MADIKYYFLSLESEYFPFELLDNDNLVKEVPTILTGSGEELYVDILHPAVIGIDPLLDWNRRIGPVILVTRSGIDNNSGERIKDTGFEIISIDDVKSRIGNRSTLANSPDKVVSRKEPDERGTIDEIAWSELLVSIYSLKISGTLYLIKDKIKKVVNFYNGFPVEIKSNKRGELFGRMLVEEGIITDEQCDESLEVMKKEKILQGEALISLGYIDETTVKDGLSRQWAIKLIDIFEWTDGEYTFKKNTVNKPSSSIAFPFWELIYNGLIFAHKGLIDASISRISELFPVPNPNGLLRYQPIPSMIDFSLFQKINGKITVSEFLKEDKGEIRRILLALLMSDSLILSKKPLPVPIPFGGIPMLGEVYPAPEDILDIVEKEFDLDGTDIAVIESLLRKLHPDRFIHLDGDYQNKVLNLFNTLLEKRKFPSFKHRFLNLFYLGWKKRLV